MRILLPRDVTLCWSIFPILKSRFILPLHLYGDDMAEEKAVNQKQKKLTWLKKGECGLKALLLKHQATSYDFKWGMSGN